VSPECLDIVIPLFGRARADNERPSSQSHSSANWSREHSSARVSITWVG
jgi:hypothetical protein